MGSNKHYNHLGVGPSLWAAPCCREAERREEGGQEGCGLLTMSWSFTFQLFVHRQNQSPSISGLSGYLVCRPMGERTARSEGFTLWAWEKYIHWLLFCKTNRGSDRRTDGHTATEDTIMDTLEKCMDGRMDVQTDTHQLMEVVERAVSRGMVGLLLEWW